MEIIEHKIGETFCLEDGTKLEIAKSTCNCKDCYFFNNKGNGCSGPKNIEPCHPLKRKDKEFIIFKQIKDNNMKEKRNIQISLEEAKEWYTSGDSFKRELALKIYKEIELSITTYSDVRASLRNTDIADSIAKGEVYRKLLNVAKCFNNIYSIKYDYHSCLPIYYTITKKWEGAYFTKYKDFSINKSVCKSIYEIAFNSSDAAKKAIDILGDELNILFE